MTGKYMMNTTISRRIFLLPMAALLIAGCRVGPIYKVPSATAQAPPAVYKEAPANFPDSDTWKPAQPQE